jgi:putative copper export protein
MQRKAVLTLGVCVLLGLAAVSHAAVAEKVRQGQQLAEHMHADICSAALLEQGVRLHHGSCAVHVMCLRLCCGKRTYLLEWFSPGVLLVGNAGPHHR